MKKVSTQPINDLVQKNASQFLHQLDPIVSRMVSDMQLPEDVRSVARMLLIAEAISRMAQSLTAGFAGRNAHTDQGRSIH